MLSDGDEICRNAEEIVLIIQPWRSTKRELSLFIFLRGLKMKGLHCSNKVTSVLTGSLFSRGVGAYLVLKPSLCKTFVLISSFASVSSKNTWKCLFFGEHVLFAFAFWVNASCFDIKNTEILQ